MKFSIFVICIIAGLEFYALYKGHDGIVLTTSISSITFIAGWFLKGLKGKYGNKSKNKF